MPSCNSSGTNQVLNLRFVQLRTPSNNSQSGKEHFDQSSVPSASPVVPPPLHSLVVSSSTGNALEEEQPVATSTLVPNTTASSTAASLVTASGSLISHPSMYVFPTTAVSTPLRATPTAVTSAGNVFQVRFRASTPTKASISIASPQQVICCPPLCGILQITV